MMHGIVVLKWSIHAKIIVVLAAPLCVLLALLAPEAARSRKKPQEAARSRQKPRRGSREDERRLNAALSSHALRLANAWPMRGAAFGRAYIRCM
jgi:hypothetical protein